MPLGTPLRVYLEFYGYEHVEKDKGAQRAGRERRPKAVYVFGVLVRSVTAAFIGPPGDFG